MNRKESSRKFFEPLDSISSKVYKISLYKHEQGKKIPKLKYAISLSTMNSNILSLRILSAAYTQL